MNRTAHPFPEDLRCFVKEEKWTYAKTMPEWPHEYIVRERVDEALFEAMVKHIRKYGYKEQFYNKTITYFAEGGMIYWTMGAPIDETIIINRCKEEDSYENRRKSGTLPEDRRRNKQKSE